MKLLLFTLGFLLSGCAQRVIVKDCHDLLKGFKNCELVSEED